MVGAVPDVELPWAGAVSRRSVLVGQNISHLIGNTTSLFLLSLVQIYAATQQCATPSMRLCTGVWRKGKIDGFGAAHSGMRDDGGACCVALVGSVNGCRRGNAVCLAERALIARWWMGSGGLRANTGSARSRRWHRDARASETMAL